MSEGVRAYLESQEDPEPTCPKCYQGVASLSAEMYGEASGWAEIVSFKWENGKVVDIEPDSQVEDVEVDGWSFGGSLNCECGWTGSPRDLVIFNQPDIPQPDPGQMSLTDG